MARKFDSLRKEKWGLRSQTPASKTAETKENERVGQGKLNEHELGTKAAVTKNQTRTNKGKPWKKKTSNKKSSGAESVAKQAADADTESVYVELKGIKGRRKEFQERDHKLTKKIKLEAQWWSQADYQQKEVDWKERWKLQVTPSYIAERRWLNGEDNQAEKEVPSLTEKDSTDSVKHDGMDRDSFRHSLLPIRSRSKEELPPQKEDIPRDGWERRSRRSSILPPILRQDRRSTGNFYQDITSSHYTIFQHKETLESMSTTPPDSQSLSERRATETNAERDLYADLDEEERIADKLRRKERATLAEVRKSSEMLNSWSVNIDKGRKASKRGSVMNKKKRESSKSVLLPPIIASGALKTELASRMGVFCKPDKWQGPDFRRTGKVVVRRNRSGRPRFKFIRLSQSDIRQEEQLLRAAYEKIKMAAMRYDEYQKKYPTIRLNAEQKDLTDKCVTLEQVLKL